MIEPVALQDFFITFFSGAGVILAGALYALLLAWSRLRKQRWAAIGAYLAYGLLALSVLTLGSALNLTGPWRIIVITMLVGYFAAPHAIWHLCRGTHENNQDTPDNDLNRVETQP